MTSALLAIFIGSCAVLIYTYAGYPVLLEIIARVARRASAPPNHVPDELLPAVTMIVAAYNEGDIIQSKLRNTWEIDYPTGKLTLFVGSDGSSDATAEILTREIDPRLKSFIYSERRGKISVLNDLVSRVNDDLLIMSDANTMYERDAVRRLVSHFFDPEIGCVSGELRLMDDGGASGEGIYWKYENWVKRNSSRLGFLIGCNGGIYAIRRNAYRNLQEDTIVDDFVICLNVLKQGYRVVLDPYARATEPACAGAAEEMVRKIRIGAGGWQAVCLTSELLSPKWGMIALAYWSQKVLRWASPILILLAILANLGLMRIPVFAVLLALQAGGIILSGIAAKTSFGQRTPKILRPITYFYLMNYSLLCGLWRFLTKTQSVTWERGLSRTKPSGPATIGK